jgi:propionyl-CoA synthetase
VVPGRAFNTCWNAVDRHVAAGRGEHVALIWDSPVTGQIRHSPTVSCAMRSLGWPASSPVSVWVKGDRVLSYMPMVPEAAIAMLAARASGDPLGRLRRVCRR